MSVTLIMNYFVRTQITPTPTAPLTFFQRLLQPLHKPNIQTHSEFKTEITEYPSTEIALKRVKELRDQGIELTESHYGLYISEHGLMVELKKAA